ncbi:SIS domain-containing protein [Ruficoccus amylovorans]|uniref:SIS domain-containing protein n=1 Tax=Ruficoccus amylovorans TaxID=1804625 RepID=A0A842HGH0_9BACT|nr:SIS domain-containing protein [Ruficoccus amylovorans]MBC2595623.1 SIS domain-containing protein [Ruficoccus amylovorans]
MKFSIEAARNELAEVLSAFTGQLPAVERSGRAIIECLHQGGKILSAGNGGSAADALHLAEEFTGRYKGDRPSLAGLCLSVDATVLTCIANDYGFDAVFSRQIEGLGRPGDVFVGFTTSGNSSNLLAAFEVCRERGVTSILVSGGDGGKAHGLTDYEILVPSRTTARIQEIHTFILHQWLEMVEQEEWH